MHISYIVVTYQREEFLQRCLESIYGQEGLLTPAEIIIIDNGGNANVLLPVNSDVTVRIERPSENLGAVGGRNLGMRLAQGRLFVFLDDDAEWHKSTDVAHLVDTIESNPRCGAVAVRSLDPSGQIIPREMPHPNKDYIQKASEPVEVPYFYTMGLILRSEVYDRIGGYPERFRIYMEEVDLSLRLYNAGYYILYDPAVAVIHHRAGSGRPIQGPGYWQQNALNKIRVAWRHLPVHYLLTTLIVWSVAVLIKTKSLSLLVKLWQSLWEERRLLMQERLTIRPEILHYLRRIGARLSF